MSEVVDALRDADRLILCTHEHPDGDALGSLSGLQRALAAIGKDALAYLGAAEFPLPYEYDFLSVDNLVTALPADVASRTVVYLDCGNVDRNPALADTGGPIVNIDHHHDNTRFGTVNHVVPDASSTAEIVWTLLEPLGAPLTHPIAEALYVGLITDTGQFMYENTGPTAHRMAAELHEAGVDAQAVYRALYENVPAPKLALLARTLGAVCRYDGDALTTAYVSAGDFAAVGAQESYTEGIVDHLRALEGTVVAALLRDQLGRPGWREVSLRSVDDRVDVSQIARELGGGGHRRAAGFSTELPAQEIVSLVRREVAGQLGVSATA